jgi:hypothetical protein
MKPPGIYSVSLTHLNGENVKEFEVFRSSFSYFVNCCVLHSALILVDSCSPIHLMGSTFSSCTPESAGPGAGQQSPGFQNIVEPVPGSLEVGTVEVRVKLPVHLVQCRQEEKCGQEEEAHVAHFTTEWKFWLLGKKKAGQDSTKDWSAS